MPPTAELNPPYGGRLVNLLVPQSEHDALKRHANTLPFLQVTARTLCDLEMLASGAFSPIETFLGQQDYQCVLHEMRLANGTLFPIPITLPARQGEFKVGQEIALRDSTSEVLAVLSISEVFSYDPVAEQTAILGTNEPKHPLVAEMAEWGKVYLSGGLRVLKLPTHFDFPSLRLTPSETRRRLTEIGNPNVVAFHTRSPFLRIHEEITRRAIESLSASLLIHPAAGIVTPGDVDYFTRVRTYRAHLEHHLAPNHAVLALSAMASRLAGPRSAVLQAIVQRNFGASAFIVGPNHEGAGVDSQGLPFFEPFAAQKLATQVEGELGIRIFTVGELRARDGSDVFEEGQGVGVAMSSDALREIYLSPGLSVPEWVARPEIAHILEEAYPPKCRQGACIWLTGLPSSGKSTVANVLSVLLLEAGRGASLLDGDVVRTHLSKGLGFSKEDRDTNILRIGFVSSEIARAGGLVITAAVSPYEHTRNQVRHMFPRDRFIEVFVNTPLSECERRDVKGLYQRARLGEATGVTGIDDPYEPPANPEIEIDTINCSAEANARQIVALLQERGFLKT